MDLCKEPLSAILFISFIADTLYGTLTGVIMPKRAVPTSRPEILLDVRLPMPLHKQLYERLRRVILNGQLEP